MVCLAPHYEHRGGHPYRCRNRLLLRTVALLSGASPVTKSLRTILLGFICLSVAFSICAADTPSAAPAPPYPLWDGHESVTDYAKRVNLPPTKTLDLGNNIKLDLVLIPAGKFIMGTPAPEKPIVGQIMVGVSGGVLFVAVLLLLIRARMKRTRLQFSLA